MKMTHKNNILLFSTFCQILLFLVFIKDGFATSTSSKLVNISVDRKDRIYVEGDVGILSVRYVSPKVKFPLQLVTEASYIKNGEQKYLSADPQGADRVQFAFKIDDMNSIKTEVFEVNIEKRASLEKQIDGLEKQIQKLNQLISSNPTSDLIERRDKLQIESNLRKSELALTKKSVYVENLALQRILNDVSLTITSPVEKSMRTEAIVQMTGKLSSSIDGLSLFVDGDKVDDLSPTGDFAFELSDLQIGRNHIQVEVARGLRTLNKKIVEFTYSPPGSKVETLNVTGGSLEVNSPESAINGVKVTVPENSMLGPKAIMIMPADSQDIPIGKIQISKAFSLGPFLMHFMKDVEVRVPIDNTKIPSGRTFQDVKILTKEDGEWKEVIPVTRTSTYAIFKTSDFEYDSIIAVVDVPAGTKALGISSNVQGATVYVNEVFKGDITPAVFNDLSAGQYDVKVYAPGYNETFQSINYSGNVSNVSIALTKPSGAVPRVQIPALNGASVSDSFINIAGQLSLNGNPAPGGKLIVSVNSNDVMQRVSDLGAFVATVPLFLGRNKIEIRYTLNGQTGSSGIFYVERNPVSKSHRKMNPQLYIESPEAGVKLKDQNGSLEKSMFERLSQNDSSQEIRVVMTWNRNETDIDMHIYDTFGGHAYYGNKNGVSGGALDHDNVTGYGPETFVLPNPRPGTYTFKTNYFNSTSILPTRVLFHFYVGGVIVNISSVTLTAQGQTIDVYSITIPEVTIASVEGVNGPSEYPMRRECGKYWDGTCVTGRFTSAPGDNKLLISTDVIEGIEDQEIQYEVREMTTASDILNSSRGRSVEITLPKIKETGFARKVEPLAYRVRALVNNTYSKPFYIVQDFRSQLRQEYEDYREYRKTATDKKRQRFTIPTPEYDEIFDRNSFLPSESGYYQFANFTKDSDFRMLAIVNNSRLYADASNDQIKIEIPDSPLLSVSSAWRNPRNNHWLDLSSENSQHQTGDALDFRVDKKNIPKVWGRDLSWLKALRYVCEVASRGIKTPVYTTVHVNHVHIEKKERNSDKCAVITK